MPSKSLTRLVAPALVVSSAVVGYACSSGDDRMHTPPVGSGGSGGISIVVSSEASSSSSISMQCTNMKQDGDETDVDCGGKACPACTMGKHCGADKDCAMPLVCL